VGRSALIRVVRNRVLQFEEVGASGGVDVCGVALAVDVALALHVVLVLEAAGALEFRIICCEADVEAVVAAGGAAEVELIDKESAVVLGAGALAAAVAVFAARCGGGSGGGKADGTEGDDSGGTHSCEGSLLLLSWFYVLLKWLRIEGRRVSLVIKVLSVEYRVLM
jgi:hypothetical protein